MSVGPADLFFGKEHCLTCNIGDVIVVPEFDQEPWAEFEMVEPPSIRLLAEKPGRRHFSIVRRKFARVMCGGYTGWQRIA